MATEPRDAVAAALQRRIGGWGLDRRGGSGGLCTRRWRWRRRRLEVEGGERGEQMRNGGGGQGRG
jgi:hypothetical protein